MGVSVQKNSGMFIGDADVVPAIGKITITENGSNIDVAPYAQADVNVPQPNGGKITLTENASDVDIWNYETADVAVPTHEEDYIDLIEGDVVHFDVPEGVTRIKRGLFSYDTVLEEVTFPDSCTEISDSAFNHCDSLHTINIGSNINLIGSQAFQNSGLRSLNLHGGINMGTSCFASCSRLKNVIVNSLGSNAFAGSGIENLTIGNQVSTIPNACFQNNTHLLNLEIPAYVETLEANSFYGCSSIRALTLNEGLKTIKSYAFYSLSVNNNVTDVEVTLPSTLTTVETNAFAAAKVKIYYIMCPASSLSTDIFGVNPNAITTDIYFVGTQVEWEARNITIPAGCTVHYNYVPTE